MVPTPMDISQPADRLKPPRPPKREPPMSPTTALRTVADHVCDRVHREFFGSTHLLDKARREVDIAQRTAASMS